VLVHVHDQIVPPLPLRVLNSLSANDRNRCLCVSSAIGPAVTRGYGFDADACSVLPNAIDLEKFSRHRAERNALRARLLNVQDGRPVIGVVARFFPVKGQAALIAALPRLLQHRPDALVVFVGDGPERKACEALARKLGIERAVRFLGQRHDVPELMNCFDVVAMPSRSEGLPLAAIEAMAAGVPVVATDVGGISEVVTHHRVGLLAPAGDVAALVGLICQLLDDQVGRHRMAAAALGDAGRFSVHEHVQRLREIYLALLAPAQP
jgi:glycosyltransferase involved in cell wall biosynthesis